MNAPVLTDPVRKRLLYRAMHRGIKEADLVIGGFAQANLASMSAAQIEEFPRLLEVPDQDLYAWATGQVTPPSGYQGEVMRMLQEFPVARHVAEVSAGRKALK